MRVIVRACVRVSSPGPHLTRLEEESPRSLRLALIEELVGVILLLPCKPGGAAKRGRREERIKA